MQWLHLTMCSLFSIEFPRLKLDLTLSYTHVTATTFSSSQDIIITPYSSFPSPFKHVSGMMRYGMCMQEDTQPEGRHQEFNALITHENVRESWRHRYNKENDGNRDTRRRLFESKSHEALVLFLEKLFDLLEPKDLLFSDTTNKNVVDIFSHLKQLLCTMTATRFIQPYM